MHEINAVILALCSLDRFRGHAGGSPASSATKLRELLTVGESEGTGSGRRTRDPGSANNRLDASPTVVTMTTYKKA